MDLPDKINHFYYHMALYELQLMSGGDFYNGLSYNSLLYLNVIGQMKDCTVSRLADALCITRAAVTLKVNELVKQGAVFREQSPADRRVYFLRLSPPVRHITYNYDEIFLRIEEDLRKKYTEPELELFGTILQTISGYEWRTIRNGTQPESK